MFVRSNEKNYLFLRLCFVGLVIQNDDEDIVGNGLVAQRPSPRTLTCPRIVKERYCGSRVRKRDGNHV